MTDYAREYALDLARWSLRVTVHEFPEYAETWAAQKLLRYALQNRMSFRQAAMALRRSR